ncbi:MAG TPA: GntR family transcriptional regulator [Solirubrobacter sp.]|nr:GntR family transcriptional regulator [Solirubrobacter sp.]
MPSSSNSHRAAKPSSQQVFEVLAHRISRSQLPAGERLAEEALSREFGVSRTPVREALRRLEQAGLVERQEHGRYAVRALDLARIDQLYTVRIVLEELAVSLTAPVVGTPAFERLLADTRAAAADTDGESPDHEMREEFHERLAALSGYDELVRMLSDIDLRIYACRRLDTQLPGRATQGQVEHLRIIELLAEGKVDEAKQAMREHIDGSRATVRSLMRAGITTITFAAEDSPPPS